MHSMNPGSQILKAFQETLLKCFQDLDKTKQKTNKHKTKHKHKTNTKHLFTNHNTKTKTKTKINQLKNGKTIAFVGWSDPFLQGGQWNGWG
mmetsp:Transcript_5687/g.12656  ORF Transcript_5687/g.12656 Transcript_5687/m.12656 type:complete len:91 (+) Transcript_5687:355-627(+)